MVDTDQLKVLTSGVGLWNAWIQRRPGTQIDFSDASLRQADLSYAILRYANLRGADLGGAHLIGTHLNLANLRGANLRGAHVRIAQLNGADLRDAKLTGASLSGTNLTDADLRGADLSYASLIGTYFFRTNLSGANLRKANLEKSIFVEANLSNAVLAGCRVFGVSAWGLILDGANQKNLRITPDAQPSITVDDLEVAQFIYLMLNNQKVRNVINTITSKAVLILGRFTPDRKAILDAIRKELRQQDYLPIIFDFDQPYTRDLTETISTLAHMARFIITDITEPRSVPQELHAIIPHLPSVPVQPLLLASENEYGMFEHFKKYPWVLETHIYESSEKLMADLKAKVIAPAEAKAKEIRS